MTPRTPPGTAPDIRAVSVIPSLKLTDRGFVDADAWKLVLLQA